MFERVVRRASRLLPELRPDERGDANGALITLFGMMVGHALLETGRDALFLAGLPAVRLPWAYLAIAGASLVMGGIPDRVVRRLSPTHELSGWLVLAGGVTFGFWLLLGQESQAVSFGLYVWSGVLATLVVVRFWITLGNIFTVTQAKRVFPLVGVGSLLGALIGSAFARVLTAAFEARHVVLAAAVAFILTSLGPRLFRPTERAGREKTTGTRPADLANTARFIWNHAYLRRVIAIILLATIAFTLVDFVFKSVVDRTVPVDRMGTFFSTVYLVISVIALAVQLFVVSRLVRGVGVHAAQMVVPTMIVAGSLGFVAFAGLALAVLLKGIDGGLRHSMYRTTTELFFVPLSVDVRNRVKTLIDVVGQRGGQAIASLAILIGISITSNEVLFAAAAAAVAAAWVFLNRDIRSHYTDVFRQTLSQDVTETRIAFPALDVASLETLLSTLNSIDDRKVLAALDLLVDQGKIGVIPALILYHPSSVVVCHALDLFLHSPRDDFMPIVRRLVEHPDPAVRTGAIRVLSVRQPDTALLRRGLEDTADEVRATALVGLVGSGALGTHDGVRDLANVAHGGSEAARVALAHAIQEQPSSTFQDTLATLANATELDVQMAAVRAMSKVQSPTFIPILLHLLEHRSVRREVRDTLASFPAATIERLSAALRDRALPHRIRRHIPGVLGEFGTAQASQALVDSLTYETDGMIRFKTLRALGKLHANNTEVLLDADTIDKIIKDSVGNTFKLMRWRREINQVRSNLRDVQTPAGDLLVALLHDKQDHSVERLCRLMNLRWQTDDFLRVHRGFKEGDRLSVASSRELLEQLTTPPLRSQLLELVDDLYDPDDLDTVDPRVDLNAKYLDTLLEIYRSSMESLSSIAAHHLAELGATGMVARLEDRDDFSAYHREIVSQVRMTLSGADSGHA